MKRSIFVCFFIAIFSLSTYASYLATSRPEVQTYIQHLVSQYDFDEDALQNLFNTVTIEKEAIRKMEKPAEAKPWYVYKKLFITEDRINKGVAYWQEHEKILALAEKKYGVPASIIVSILGVETKYGENKGNFPVFNTLVTLAFNYSHRSNFFRSELTEFLLLTRENHFSPLLLKGSYAGAVGLPQFMPSSYRQYAIDFGHKGFADLFANHDDAICSVGNYLKKHGWKKGEPIAIAARVHGMCHLSLIQTKHKPSLTLAALEKCHVEPQQPFKGKFSFFRLQNENGYGYWLGLQNFYAITTYNNSELYVMAVRELARRIEERKSCTEL